MGTGWARKLVPERLQKICKTSRERITFQYLYVDIDIAKLEPAHYFEQQFDLRCKITIFVVCVVPLRL